MTVRASVSDLNDISGYVLELVHITYIGNVIEVERYGALLPCISTKALETRINLCTIIQDMILKIKITRKVMIIK